MLGLGRTKGPPAISQLRLAVQPFGWRLLSPRAGRRGGRSASAELRTMSGASPAAPDISTSGSEPHPRRRSHLDVVLDQAEHLLGLTPADR